MHPHLPHRSCSARIRLLAAVVGALVLAGCIIPGRVYRKLQAEVAIPLITDVDRIDITVAGEDEYGVFQEHLASISLQQSNGAWRGSFGALPAGPPLDFSGEAYVDEELAFAGVALGMVLTGDGDQINVPLASVAERPPIEFPIITALHYPTEIYRGHIDHVTVEAEVSDAFEVEFFGGPFLPDHGYGVFPHDVGSFTTLHAAPQVPGEYDHGVTITNLQNNAITTEFRIRVVDYGGAFLVTPIHGPIMESVSVRQHPDGLILEAIVRHADAGDPFQYAWSAAGVRSEEGFTDASLNPTVLVTRTGATGPDGGPVSLTVTDARTGLSTRVDFTPQP